MSDMLASSGVADGTPIDTFFAMQGTSIFVTHEDLFDEVLANDEDLREASEEDIEMFLLTDAPKGDYFECLD